MEEEKEKRKNRVEITTSADLKENPVFVECSADEIKTKEIKTSKIQNFTRDGKNDLQFLTVFYNWLKKNRDSDKECIVLIIKPSASSYTEMVMGIVKNEGFKYNMEPMEEEKTGIYE